MLISFLDFVFLDKPPILLTHRSQATAFRSHGGIVHVFLIRWDNQTDALELLKIGEYFRIGRNRIWLDHLMLIIGAIGRLKRRIEFHPGVLARKVLTQFPNRPDTNLGIDIADRCEPCDIGLEK